MLGWFSSRRVDGHNQYCSRYRRAKRRRVVNQAYSVTEALEARLLLATNTWALAAGGDWDTASNWSLGHVPMASEDVVINGSGSFTVTHSTGSDSCNSITSNEAFTLSGGSLTVATTVQVSNTFTLSGGTLSGATVLAGNSGQGLTASGGTLSGVTLNGNATGSSGNITVLGNLTLNGTMSLGNSSGNLSGVLDFSSSNQTLTGNGTILFASGNLSNGVWETQMGATLTIGPGINVHGQVGTVGCHYAGTTLVNQGTIDADGGEIFLAGPRILNSGTLECSNNHTLIIEGTLNNSGQTLTLVGINGPVNLSGGTILGGTVGTAAGAPLNLSYMTLNGVTLASNATILSGNITFTNGLTLNNANLTVSNFGPPFIYFQGTQTLGGTGQIISTGTYPNYVYAKGGGNAATAATLTIGRNITVDGSAGVDIAGYYSFDSIYNQGTINANTSGQTINIGEPGNWTNTGTLECTNGGTLNLYGNLTNNGNVSATAGSVNVYGPVQGGSITVASAATLNVISADVTANGLTANGNVTVSSSCSLTILGNMTLNATMTLGTSSYNDSGAVNFYGNQTLAGNGTILFATNNYNGLFETQTAATLTIGPGITIQGVYGTVGGNGSGVILVNQGTIAPNAGGTIVVMAPGGLVNSGTLSVGNATVKVWPQCANVSNSGNVSLGVKGNLSITGNLTLLGNGTLTEQIGGAPGSGSYGNLSVTGTAVLGGAENVVAMSYLGNSADLFTPITAGTLSGTFATLTSSGFAAGLYPQPSYTATKQSLTLTKATQLVFTVQPGNTSAGTALSPVAVSIESASGSVLLADSNAVTLAVGSGPGVLGGNVTANAVNGVATFNNVSIINPGTYTLTAADSTDALSGFASGSFTITPNAPPAWVGSGGNVNWIPCTQTLIVTGSTTITADPGASGNTPIINITGNANLIINTGCTGCTVNFSSLTLQTGTTLDLQNNLVCIGNTTADPLSAIQSSIFCNQIISSNLPAGCAIGYANVVVGSASYTEFGCALKGDANLAGTVNLNDVSTVLANYGQSTMQWQNGNFEYNPANPGLNTTVNINDLSDVLGHYGDSVAAGTVLAANTPAAARPASPTYGVSETFLPVTQLADTVLNGDDADDYAVPGV